MAITLVASVSATPGINGGATAAVDTTGATLLVISVSSYGVGAVPTVSDAKGNVYTALTSRTQGTARHRLFYRLAPTVGTGHTFTVTGAGIYAAILAYAFAGVGSYQTESGTTATSGASLASGSVTPSTSGALIVTGIAGGVATTDTVAPVGFAVTTKPFVSGTTMHGSAAWQVQAVAAAINPTWSFTPSQTPIALGSAVFLASAAVETAQGYVWGPL